MSRNDPEKQEAIIQCALKKFLKTGVKKSSYSDIAKEVGLSVTMLGYYYKDKDALVLGCADRFHRDHLRESRRICDSNLDPLAKMKIYVLNRFYAWREINDATTQALELGAILLRVGPDRINDDEDLFIKTASKILQQGVDAKMFKIDRVDREARLVVTCFGTCFPMSGLRRPRQPGEKELIELVEWFGAKWKRR